MAVHGQRQPAQNRSGPTAQSAAIVPDIAILIVEFFLLFAAAFVAFLRYDVR